MAAKGERTETLYPLLESAPKGGSRPAAMASEGKTSNINLYIASCVCNLAAFSAGNALTWSSPTITKMKEQNLILHSQESWLGSLIALGAAFGPFLAGFLVDRIGRKTSLLLNSVLILISWAFIAVAIMAFDKPSFEVIYTARVLAGIAAGVCYTITPMYIGEIAEDSVRGALGSLMAFFLCAGFVLEYVVGPYTSYVVLIAVSALAPVVFAISFFFMPESPYYLIGKDKKAEALRALQWLRGADDASTVQKELTNMQNSVTEAQAQRSGIRELVSTKGNCKALYISCGLVAFQQLSGINVILFYSEPIFNQTGVSLSSAISTIIVGTVMVISAGIAPPLAKCLGMKKLLIISAIGMFLFQSILGLFFCLKKQGVNVSDVPLNFLPVGCMVLYIFTYCLGFGPLPWAVMGEMFPANVKAIASAVTASFCWILGFIITKCFDSIADFLGMDFAFWIFAIFCVVALLFTIFLLPETKGLSLQEIQDLLNGREVNRKT